MALTFTPGRDRIKISGLKSWYVKDFADAVGAYYPLDKMFDGKVSIKTLTQKDSLGREIPFGAELDVTAKIFNTDKAVILKTLDKLGSKSIKHVINAISGMCLASTNLAIPTFGTKWKFICDADADKNRYVEFTATRRLATSEVAELLTGVAPSYGTTDAGDTFVALNAISNAGIYPAGFSVVTLCETYNGSFQNVGTVYDGKLIAELLTQKDSLGQDVGYAVKFDVEFKAMQTDNAYDLTQYELLNTSPMFYKITLIDGTVVTLGNSAGSQAGISWHVQNDKDSDGVQYSQFAASGIVPLLAVDAIFA